jgi:two-component system, NtrC family, response regulator AtoC
MTVAPTHPGRLLLADADKAVRDQLLEFLTDLGYEVDVAPTTDDMVSMSDCGQYRVILFDANVADRPVEAILERLLSIGGVPGIVVMSGEPKLRAVLAAFRGGAADYVVKPFEIGDLSDIVGRAAQISRAAGLMEVREGRLMETGPVEVAMMCGAARVSAAVEK